MEANPDEMKSGAEHQEVSKENATAKPVRALRKRHRGWNLVAECHSQLQERTWGNCGSRKKLAATGRKMTRHAGATRHKVHVVRKYQTRLDPLKDGCSGRNVNQNRKVSRE
jgi:hypothetical protein